MKDRKRWVTYGPGYCRGLRQLVGETEADQAMSPVAVGTKRIRCVYEQVSFLSAPDIPLDWHERCRGGMLRICWIFEEAERQRRAKGNER